MSAHQMGAASQILPPHAVCVFALSFDSEASRHNTLLKGLSPWLRKETMTASAVPLATQPVNRRVLEDRCMFPTAEAHARTELTHSQAHIQDRNITTITNTWDTKSQTLLAPSSAAKGKKLKG